MGAQVLADRPYERERLGFGAGAVVAVAYWTIVVVIAVTYAVLKGFQYQLSLLPGDAMLVLSGAAASIALSAGLRQATRLEFRRQVGTAALLVLLVAWPFDFAFKVIGHFLFDGPPLYRSPMLVLQGGLFWLAPFGLWAACNLAMHHSQDARLRERRLAALQIEAHEAQVRALRYQINPHFLYNTLNSIAALILDGRNEVAEEMVLRLSAFFRATLTIDPLRDITLSEEIALQLRYLDVERLRFEDNLEVDIDVPSELENARVPSLILQPLVENALKHGAPQAGMPMRLRIRACSHDKFLRIEVSDNGRGKEPGGFSTGLGLKNVANRLASRFGGRSRVEAFPEPGGFTVRLSIPNETL